MARRPSLNITKRSTRVTWHTRSNQLLPRKSLKTVIKKKKKKGSEGRRLYTGGEKTTGSELQGKEIGWLSMGKEEKSNCKVDPGESLYEQKTRTAGPILPAPAGTPVQKEEEGNSTKRG